MPVDPANPVSELLTCWHESQAADVHLLCSRKLAILIRAGKLETSSLEANAPGAVAALATTMRTFPDHEQIQIAACTALHTVSAAGMLAYMRRQEYIKGFGVMDVASSLADADGDWKLEGTFESMIVLGGSDPPPENQSQHSQMQQFALNLSTMKAYGDEDPIGVDAERRQLAASAAIPDVFRAMQNHRSPQMQLHGLALLHNLLPLDSSPLVVDAIMAVHGLPVILWAARTFSDRSQLEHMQILCLTVLIICHIALVDSVGVAALQEIAAADGASMLMSVPYAAITNNLDGQKPRLQTQMLLYVIGMLEACNHSDATHSSCCVHGKLHVTTQNMGNNFAQNRHKQQAANRPPPSRGNKNPFEMGVDDFVSITPEDMQKAKDMVQLGLLQGTIDRNTGNLVELGQAVRDARRHSNVDAVIVEAEPIRLRGNDAIQAGDNEQAVVAYTQAVSLLAPHVFSYEAATAYTKCLSNRAEALLRLKKYAEADDDCTAAASFIDHLVVGLAMGDSRAKELNTLAAKVSQRQAMARVARASAREAGARAERRRDIAVQRAAQRAETKISKAERRRANHARREEEGRAEQAELEAMREEQQVAAAQAELEKLAVAANDEPECSICLEGDDFGPMSQACGAHWLHVTCAVAWRTRCWSGANDPKCQPREPTCPMCRAPI